MSLWFCRVARDVGTVLLINFNINLHTKLHEDFIRL